MEMVFTSVDQVLVAQTQLSGMILGLPGLVAIPGSLLTGEPDNQTMWIIKTVSRSELMGLG